jgi:hypothetical protein
MNAQSRWGVNLLCAPPCVPLSRSRHTAKDLVPDYKSAYPAKLHYLKPRRPHTYFLVLRQRTNISYYKHQIPSMADYAKFEAIRTQAIESEHTSLNSTDGTRYRSGVEPQPLSWWQASRFIGTVMDVFAIALSCAFLAFAIAVKMHENLPMGSEQVKLLLRLSKLVSIQASGGFVSSISSFVRIADKSHYRVPLSTLFSSLLSLAEPSSQLRSGSSRGAVRSGHWTDFLAV